MFRGLLGRLCVAFAVLVGPSTAHAAAPQQSAFDAAKVNRWIDDRLGPDGKSGKLGAAIVIVFDHGKVVAQRSYSYEDLGRRRRTSVDNSLFRIASISKVFTATAIAQLVERGRIRSIDDPVNNYLKRIKIPPNNGQHVTIRQLLTHTAGFEDLTYRFYTRTEERTASSGRDLTRPLAGFARPANQFLDYSNFGAAILGLAIEDISGQSFAEYVNANIFRPLGMNRTAVLAPSTLTHPHLVGSLKFKSDGMPEPMRQRAISPLLAPAGGIMTTGADMLKFMLAASRTEAEPSSPLMTARAQRRMFEPLARDHPAMMAVGEGWFTYLWNGHLVVEHGGDLPGAHSMMTLLPERQAGIFISIASQDARSTRNADANYLHPRQINNDLLRELLGPRKLLDRPAGKERADIPLEELAGRYVRARGAYHSVATTRQVLEVRKAGSNLEIEGVGTLRPLGANLYEGPGQLIWDAAVFKRDRDGSLILMPFFPVSAFEKVPFWRDPDYAQSLATAGLALLATGLALLFYRDGRRAARQAKWIPVAALVYLAAFDAALTLPIWSNRTVVEAYEDGSQHGFVLLIVLAHLISLLAVACTIETYRVWRQRFWGVGQWGAVARAHYTALTIAAWSPIPLFFHMHLLGWHLP
jgi:CubicO group peptidase (beta-lactamase class C family)